MNILVFNFFWMTFNIILAVLAVFFGWLIFYSNRRWLIVVYLALWILLLPNTVYLFTDLINLFNQWGRATNFEKIVFIFQYIILQIFGAITFIYALYPLEKWLQRVLGKYQLYTNSILIVINFLVGFGIVLGRVERVNSWEALTNPLIVVMSSFKVINSLELFSLFILFALFSNFFYFLFKDPVISFANICLTRAGFLK